MWIWGILGILVAVCYDYFRRTKKVDEMFPGPTVFPIIGNIRVVRPALTGFVSYVHRKMDIYGKRMRMWVGYKLVVFLAEPDDVRKILENRKHVKKSFIYRFLDILGQGIITSEGATWEKHRKILSPAFNFNILHNYLHIIQTNADTLMGILEKFVENGNFNIYPIIRSYAMNVILECSMGQEVGSHLNDGGEYIKSVRTSLLIAAERTYSPRFWSDFIFSLSSKHAENKAAVKYVDDVTNSIIDHRRDQLRRTSSQENKMNETGVRQTKVLLDILLESSESGFISQKEIMDEIKTFMIAGHDTTTSAISFSLYCLAENPEYQQTAYEEQVAIFGPDTDRAASMQELQSMKYLEKVINESMRIYTVVPGLARNLTSDIILDENTKIHKGAEVFAVLPILHADPNAWERPNEFYPDHFEPEKVAKRHSHQFIPFGAGPRKCIGYKFASLELKTTLSQVLRRFEVLPGDPQVPMKTIFRISNEPENGVNIRLRKRNQPDFSK